jgi:hypothetical protein
MTVHLVKLAVGIDDVPHLAEVQAKRLANAKARGEPAVLRHLTRHAPRRAEELLDGGSLYWVIKGFVRARQRLIGFESAVKADGHPACALLLDPTLARTRLRSFRAFQGWRYLRTEDAPPDIIAGADTADVPDDMATELKSLGLL